MWRNRYLSIFFKYLISPQLPGHAVTVAALRSRPPARRPGGSPAARPPPTPAKRAVRRRRERGRVRLSAEPAYNLAPAPGLAPPRGSAAHLAHRSVLEQTRAPLVPEARGGAEGRGTNVATVRPGDFVLREGARVAQNADGVVGDKRDEDATPAPRDAAPSSSMAPEGRSISTSR